MNYLNIILVTIMFVCLIAWCLIGINKKYKPNSKAFTHGWILLTTSIICLAISIFINSDTNKPVLIDELTDKELYEYIVGMDETKIDAWFSELTDRQQTRVFHVYMVNELDNAAKEDAFE